VRSFEITELPSHSSLYDKFIYDKFPKERFQCFQSIFERWTIEGKAHIQKQGSLNEIFPDLQPLSVGEMLEQCG
jgi:hypothetical protein